jgi:hypothetical protein
MSKGRTLPATEETRPSFSMVPAEEYDAALVEVAGLTLPFPIEVIGRHLARSPT